jgi:hypothetical protein
MMNKQTRARWMAGAAQPFTGASPHLMVRGPMVFRDKEGEGGAGGDGGDDEEGGEGGQDDNEEAIDPKAHAALVKAHNRLKKDSRADRQRIRELEEQVEALTTEAEDLRSQVDPNGDTATKVRTATENAKAPLLAEIEKLKEKLKSRDRRIENDAVEKALNEQFDSIRLKPELRKAARAMLRSQIEVDHDGDDEDAEIILSMNDLPLAEALTAWARTEEGKVFIAEGNNGGGAEGGRRGRTTKNPWKQENFNLTEQSRLEKDDPVQANRLKAEAGVAF